METAQLLEEDYWNGRVKVEGGRAEVDASGMHYRSLNGKLRELAGQGVKQIEIQGVNGQRYLGTGIRGGELKMVIHGTPGNDLAAFMDGPTLEVLGNAQDAVANTMNSGRVVIHGHAGDVLGYGMRGGRLYVRGDVGYRVGIHMKAYDGQSPVIIAGGTAGDFFGEYMAGGTLILLGLDLKPGEKIVGDWCATGIHGGTIYIRGEISERFLGSEVGVTEQIPDPEKAKIEELVRDYSREFDLNADGILRKPFLKLFPRSNRPYGKLYAY